MKKYNPRTANNAPAHVDLNVFRPIKMPRIGTNISLSWDAINTSRDFLEYRIYRDNEYLNSTNQLFYFDQGVSTGVFSYYLTAAYSGDWESEPGNVVEIDHTDAIGIQTLFVNSLSGNYPNPFNPETAIYFSVEQTSLLVNLEIYNLKGQKIKTLVNEILPAGSHSVIWNGTDKNEKPVSSGVYLYKMKTGNFVSTKKMILMK